MVKFHNQIIRMKKIFYLFILVGFSVFGQESNENFPVFQECENASQEEQESCFYNTIQTFVFNNFKFQKVIQVKEISMQFSKLTLRELLSLCISMRLQKN